MARLSAGAGSVGGVRCVAEARGEGFDRWRLGPRSICESVARSCWERLAGPSVGGRGRTGRGSFGPAGLRRAGPGKEWDREGDDGLASGLDWVRLGFGLGFLVLVFLSNSNSNSNKSI